MPDISTESDNVAIAAKIAAIIAEEMPEAHRQLKAAGQYYRYQDDPVAFCADVLGEFFTDDVKAIMESVRDYPVTIAVSANAVGKTFGGARIAVWFYKAFPDCQVYTAAAPPLENLKNLLWGQIGSIVVRHPELFAGDTVTSMDIRRSPSDFLTGVTIPSSGTAQERESKFSGKHQKHLLFVIDEGDAVPDEVYRGIESCMSGGIKSRLLIFLNPRHASGPVYRMQRDQKANVVHLSAFRHPNVIQGYDVFPGAVTRDTTVRRINEWSRPYVEGEKVEAESLFELPDFLVGATAQRHAGGLYPALPAGQRVITNAAFAYMVLGQYPAQGMDQLISREWIARARSRYDAYVLEHGDNPPVGASGVMGMDCAELGGDSNVIIVRYGGYVTPVTTWGGVDTVESANIAIGQYHKYGNISYANIDGTGVGAGVAPYMQKAGCAAVSVKVAERATMRTELGEFRILRDQLFWSCREWLRTDPGAMLPPDEMLIEELQTLTYEVVRGKIEVMKNAVLREILKRSGDRVSALCMTFAGQGGFFSDLVMMDYPDES